MSSSSGSHNKSSPASFSLFHVQGKIALVTGGGTGIGKMIASTLVQEGCKVYIASRKLNVIQSTALELNNLAMETGRGGQCIPLKADLTTKSGCQELANHIKEDKLHILVNNSGMSWGSSLENFDEPNGWDRLMALNVKSVFYMTTSLLTLLKNSANGNEDPARVINISSVISLQNNAETPLSGENNGIWSYAASKAAVNHLTRVMAKSLAQYFITVNAIAPGVFASKMTEFGIKNAKDLLEMNQPMGRIGKPEDMAGTVLYLCGKASAHCTGMIIPLDGGESLNSSKL